MKIAKDINVNLGKFSSGLGAALSLIHEMEQCRDNSCVLDLSGSRFITPLFVVSLCVYVNGGGVSPIFGGVTSYMRNVHLDSWGVDSEAIGLGFTQYLKEYEKKSYMPLVSFPTSKGKLMDSVFNSVVSIISAQSKLNSNVISGLRYMFAELSDNIREHSKAKSGYVFAQCYHAREHGFVDICIGDTGITLLGSYMSHGKTYVENDMDAIQSAIRGLSTKALPTAENRGYGVHTTMRMIVSGLGGQYSMISGSAVHYNVPGSEGYSDIPYGIRFPGTVIAMRVPLHENRNFNYINFVE